MITHNIENNCYSVEVLSSVFDFKKEVEWCVNSDGSIYVDEIKRNIKRINNLSLKDLIFCDIADEMKDLFTFTSKNVSADCFEEIKAKFVEHFKELFEERRNKYLHFVKQWDFFKDIVFKE